MKKEEILLKSLFGPDAKFIKRTEGGHLLFEIYGNRNMLVIDWSMGLPLNNVTNERR